MDPIRVVIADDEDGMRLIERKMIEKVEGFELLGEARDGEELLQLVEREHPQVVFLDVEMPKKNGVECGHLIQDLDPSIIMVFATAHDQYMGDAFEVYAFDYLVKPFRVDRVRQTLLRIRDRLQAKETDVTPLPSMSFSPNMNGGKLMLRSRDGVHFINTNEILLIQREDRSTVIYTEGNGRYTTSDTLSETEARLDPSQFFRCHKSYIINLSKMTSITPYGRWTYVVHLEGTRQDALITHEKYTELEKRFSGA
ncbi:MAG: response regulator transcription factor [Clostridia bacterium]|nr:response regulator transcription factor [Clostridia bacterium]